MDLCLTLFGEVLGEIAKHGDIPPNGETWERKALSRAQFERWMTLSPSDPPEEFQRKARALRHSHFPGPFPKMHGLRFQIPPSGKP